MKTKFNEFINENIMENNVNITDMNDIIITFINKHGKKDITGMGTYTGFLLILKSDLNKLSKNIDIFLKTNIHEKILIIINEFFDINNIYSDVVKFDDSNNMGLCSTILRELKKNIN